MMRHRCVHARTQFQNAPQHHRSKQPLARVSWCELCCAVLCTGLLAHIVSAALPAATTTGVHAVGT